MRAAGRPRGAAREQGSTCHQKLAKPSRVARGTGKSAGLYTSPGPVVTRWGRQHVALACRPPRGIPFIACHAFSGNLSSGDRALAWPVTRAAPFLALAGGFRCPHATCSPRLGLSCVLAGPQHYRARLHHCTPPVHALPTPIFPNGLASLNSLLRNHRWLPRTLGTKSSSMAWCARSPSKLFKHISQDSALGTLPSDPVDLCPRNAAGSRLCWTVHPDTPPDAQQDRPRSDLCEVPSPCHFFQGPSMPSWG